MEIRAVRRRRRRRDVRRMVRRTAAGALTTQLATVAGLLVFDSVRRKDRPDREFPHRLGEPVPVDGGEVRIYTFGEHLFEDMLADIEAATDRIYFETYIWKGDAVGATLPPGAGRRPRARCRRLHRLRHLRQPRRAQGLLQGPPRRASTSGATPS
uniref:Uncharacterized protein n=1 Tax=Janibacter limosus TaxID=53458 RepID=A0AC61U5T0_9MICO|nr:hypothetical protein [Janibacter limosus]